MVILLLGSVVIVSLEWVSQVDELQQGVEKTTKQKLQLVTSMRDIVRERTLSMFSISLYKDAFDKDEEFMRFKGLARDFTRARDAFQSMALSKEESLYFRQALDFAKKAQPLQEEIIEDVIDNKLVDVKVFIDVGIPKEMKLLSIFDQLHAAVQQAGSVALSDMKEQYSNVYWTIFALGLTAILLFIAIVRFVISRISDVERAMFKEKEHLEVTLKAIGDAVITVDADAKITYLNPIAERITGWPNKMAVGLHLDHVYRTVREDTGEQIKHPANSKLAGQVVGLQRYSMLKTRGEHEYVVEDNTSPIYNNDGELIGKVLVFRDVTHARNIERQLSWQARHDALTGLANRLEFEIHLQGFIDNAKQYDNEHILLYMDLDEFKKVNDISGHAAGDKLLQKLSKLMEEKIRRSDILARLGGDEFGVLLHSCDLRQGREIAELIRGVVNDFRFTWKSRVYTVGVSIGMLEINESSGTAADVLNAADIACYSAKALGRNRIWGYDHIVSEITPAYYKLQ